MTDKIVRSNRDWRLLAEAAEARALELPSWVGELLNRRVKVEVALRAAAADGGDRPASWYVDIAQLLSVPDEYRTERFIPTHRHRVRRLFERVIGRASLQNATGRDLVEADCLVIYVDAEGRWWARHEAEFDDGRFEELSASPKAGGNAKPTESSGVSHITLDDLIGVAGIERPPIPPASSSGQASIPSEAAVWTAFHRLHPINITYSGVLAALAAAYAIDHPAGEVAQGWQIVPVEADDGMVSAACGLVEGADPRTVWEVMLSSAPQPPREVAKGRPAGWGCSCHGMTFCPDLEFAGYENDVPTFRRKVSAPQPPKSNSGGK